MESFTPLAGLIGGLLIGLASALFLLLNGRIAGISGFLEAAMRPADRGFVTAAAFLIGLPLGAAIATRLVSAAGEAILLEGSLPLLIGAGLLVGFGARLANGCTSGHGVCGLPRLSGRSWAAVCVFMVAAAATVYVVRHLV